MMATFLLPATVLRSSGEWPCTSALGLRTRRYSAARSKLSPLSNTTVSAFLSLRSRSSVGQGLVAALAMRRSIPGRAMADPVRSIGGRVDVDRALRLGKLGDVGHRILHAQPDPAVLHLAAARARHRVLVQLVVEI